MESIHNDNNEAVEHLLLGRTSEAIATLLNAIEKCRRTNCGGMMTGGGGIIQPQPPQPVNPGNLYECDTLLYSVEMTHEIHEAAQPVLPFAWYGRPIAISASDDDTAPDDAGLLFVCPQVSVACLLYNLGIAFQLESSQPHKPTDDINNDNEDGDYQHQPQPPQRRHTHQDAVQVYMMALQVLIALPPQQTTQWTTIGERLSLGLLHLAVVNNLLYVHAQVIDMAGVQTCWTVLRDVLSKVCTGLPQEHLEDFTFFLQNTLLFPGTCNAADSTVSLPMAPAA